MDVYGVMQHWIMTIKDHSTGLVYLATRPRKTAKFVANELEKYFGFVGYPHIFHTGMWQLDINNNLDCECDNILIYVIHCFFYNTDNGKDFIAKFVVDMMKRNNPLTASLSPDAQGLHVTKALLRAQTSSSNVWWRVSPWSVIWLFWKWTGQDFWDK